MARRDPRFFARAGAARRSTAAARAISRRLRDGLAASAAVAGASKGRRTARRDPLRLRAPSPRRRRARSALEAVLADELPLNKRDGGFVRAGVDASLDEARTLARREPRSDR